MLSCSVSELCIFQVKGHKGVYQFLSMPYEIKGYEHVINTEETCATKFASSSECSLANLNGIAYSDYRAATVDIWESTKNNHERSAHNSGHTENSSYEPSEYPMRKKRLSEHSISSDCSSRSFDELETNCLISDLLKHKNENLNMVFHDENNNMCV